ncbi:glycosyltransferase [Azospirillum rugosum]|uniref:Uncharacterized protein n=1 Tax=Azospirillum rugosum TaxID=416170 RepID=A0ABS4SLD0_9PROT|nr:glycosyltransferase [Azospirillum rugosum]MBP2293373.1 hypothetical protein [Azospirillum rugosum]
MPPQPDQLVLLFFKDFETDRFFQGDRYLKRVVRPLYNLMHHKQKVSGYKMVLKLLVKALKEQGCEVRVNDHRTAARLPGHPVGLIGYPHILQGWSLPNPALLGPSLFDHPLEAPQLMRDPRFKGYLTLADWHHRMFKAHYGDVCARFLTGIDTDAWPDLSAHPKTTDVLVYDKIRWNHEEMRRTLTEPVLRHLEMRGITYELVRYKEYDYAGFKRMLARSRSLVFLCEHETQGLAYQEAMASNLPVLAWDNGFWMDPRRPRFEPEPVPASSVPYFDEALCGSRFHNADAFPAAFDAFWERLGTYQPRRYVEEHLSLGRSAVQYLEQYTRVARQPMVFSFAS